MTPVDQRMFEEGKGDCLSACFATLLDLALDEVPNFNLDPDWSTAPDRWLASRGLARLRIDFEDAASLARSAFREKRGCVLVGDSPRFGADGARKRHAVVATTERGRVEVLHDPHPSRDGLDAGGCRQVMFLVPAGGP